MWTTHHCGESASAASWWGERDPLDPALSSRYIVTIPTPPLPEWQLHFARQMRRQPTDAESLLWWRIRHDRLGVRFRRQHPIGHYIVDFVGLLPRLIVELDGSQHGGAYDERRDAFLRAQGYTVLHFWSWDVLGDLEWVVWEIAKELSGE